MKRIDNDSLDPDKIDDFMRRLRVSERQIIIKFNHTTGDLDIDTSNFSRMEAIGMLECAKLIVSHGWMHNHERNNPDDSCGGHNTISKE